MEAEGSACCVEEGIPEDKDCIIYLVPYPEGNDNLDGNNQWMLLGGDGESVC